MSNLHRLDLSFGRAAAEGKRFGMIFDTRHFTQRFIHSFLSRGELCDPPLVQALTGFLEPGDCFIDVGSHIGYYSLLALQMVGASGRVVAFEANPETFAVLAANAQLNRAANLMAYNCAVGRQPGIGQFSINGRDEGLSSMAVSSERQISVSMTSLDSLQALAPFEKVRMLKIDVEGFEPEVIAGAKRFLAEARPENIVFEINNGLPGVAPHQDEAIRAQLEALGYRCFLIRPWKESEDLDRQFAGSIFLELSPGSRVNIAYGNILASLRPLS